MGAGLLARTLSNLRGLDVGFSADHILLFGIDPVSLHYDDARIRKLYRDLRERLASLPGVRAVSFSSIALLSGSWSGSDFKIEGRPELDEVQVGLLEIGPEFLNTMEIPMRAGRTFTPADFGSKHPVAVVNEAFVRKYLAGRNALGVHFAADWGKPPQYEIIGVAGDAKYSQLRAAVEPMAYFPFDAGAAHFEVKSVADSPALIASVRKAAHDLDASLPLFDVVAQREAIDGTLVVERLMAGLAAVFGGLALTLAAVGLYGLLAYEVNRKRREIGIRMAVGAAPQRIRRAVMAETLGITAIGLVLGSVAALFVSKVLTAMLYGVKANDARNMGGVILGLLLVAAVAGYVPARRASRVDPTVALRQD